MSEIADWPIQADWPVPTPGVEIAVTLAFPFRILGNGSVATVIQDTDPEIKQLLVSHVMTRPEERPLVPGYGLHDPTFTEIDVNMLAASVAAFGPDVEIESIENEIDDRGVLFATINYRG